MNLGDFVALTLDELMQGVTNAALRQKESGRFGFINPMDGEKGDAFSSIPITNVKFDVAVTVESVKADKKGGGINIRVIEARVGREEQSEWWVSHERRSKCQSVCQLPSYRDEALSRRLSELRHPIASSFVRA